MVVKVPNAEYDAARLILNNSKLFLIKQEFDRFIEAEYKLLDLKDMNYARREFAKDYKKEYNSIIQRIREECPTIGKPGIFVEDFVQHHKETSHTYQKKYVWKGISD